MSEKNGKVHSKTIQDFLDKELTDIPTGSVSSKILRDAFDAYHHQIKSNQMFYFSFLPKKHKKNNNIIHKYFNQIYIKRCT